MKTTEQKLAKYIPAIMIAVEGDTVVSYNEIMPILKNIYKEAWNEAVEVCAANAEIINLSENGVTDIRVNKESILKLKKD